MNIVNGIIDTRAGVLMKISVKQGMINQATNKRNVKVFS